jgi:hypothetical protein
LKSNLPLVFAAATLAFLAACGGGGDSATAPTTKTVAISSSNQADVARATVNGGLAVSFTQGAVGVTPAAAAGVPTRTQGFGLALQRVLAVATRQRKGIAGASVHPAAASTNSTPCGVGGTLTSTFDDRDGNGVLSKGDVLTATFAQCQDTTSLSLNGAVAITLTGNPSGMVFDASAVFQNVVVVDNGVSSTISGTVSVNETDGTTLTETRFTVGSGGFAVAIASANYNDALAFESGMVITTSQVGGNSSTSLTLAGSFTASSIGGRVTIATPVPLIQGPADVYPTTGQVRITGAAGSTLLATVLDATQVQLQLDANGDGTYESTTTVAWSTLVP